MVFYDDSILPGTKTQAISVKNTSTFYDDSILPGTKTLVRQTFFTKSFMMTQFFQVLKRCP